MVSRYSSRLSSSKVSSLWFDAARGKQGQGDQRHEADHGQEQRTHAATTQESSIKSQLGSL